MNTLSPMLNPVKIWILLSTLLVASGWILSAFHELNPVGYVVVFGLAVAVIIFYCATAQKIPTEKPSHSLHKLIRRFHRPAPFLFLILTVLSLIAGALYVSQNNDSSEYRIPRVWHWLAAGHWHWIRTLDFRMNAAGSNFEWLSAPLMLFTRYDRFLFLINLASYLMLPGLIFSVFTRLRVRPRVAWWWTWILPSGFCYAMQAASDVNDSFAAVYALAAVDFALRAREKDKLSDFWFSILAVALLTGVKQTDLPLALPWLVAAIPCLRLVKVNCAATLATGIIALLVSALPQACLNYYYAGNWLGLPASSPFWRNEPSPAWWNVIGNAFCLPVQNLLPPYLPAVARWNEAMQHFLQTPLGSHFRGFEKFGFIAGQGATEINAGIGLWIVCLTAISIGAAIIYRRSVRPNDGLRWLRWAPFLSLLVFMATVTTFENARQLAAYYIFFFPALLVSGAQAVLVRQKWWQCLCVVAMLLTVGMLVIARNRPLFPVTQTLLPLKEKHPQSKFLAKIWESYSSRLSIQHGRDAFRDEIPAEEKVVGYATVRGAQEVGLWPPFGHRRVERILPDDHPSDLQAQGIHFVLADSDGLGLLQMGINDWTNRFNGVVIDSVQIQTSPRTIVTNYLVRLNPN